MIYTVTMIDSFKNEHPDEIYSVYLKSRRRCHLVTGQD